MQNNLSNTISTLYIQNVSVAQYNFRTPLVELLSHFCGAYVALNDYTVTFCEGDCLKALEVQK